MSGLYFLVAGKSSRNREKSLDRSLPSENISRLLTEKSRLQFLRHCSDTNTVYAWGANRIGDLSKLEADDYVVDVKNKEVMQIFRFAFWIETEDTRLQEFIGWDLEKPRDKRRPYKIVYFLTDPLKTKKSKKAYFQKAFAQVSNQNWLVGQRWFSTSEVQNALSRTSSNSIEMLLGVTEGIGNNTQRPSSHNRDQPYRIDSNIAQVNISDDSKHDLKQSIKTAKSFGQENSNSFHQSVEDKADDAPVSKPNSRATPAPQPIKFLVEAKEQHLTFKENQTGISYDKLFGAYLKGASRITLTDPFIRIFYQTRNLMEFMETVARLKEDNEETLIHLITIEDEYKGNQQKQNFGKIAEASDSIGIKFTWEFGSSGIHARHIVTDNGWKILLDRGLDIFKHYAMHDSFTFANRIQKYRACKAFEITYIRQAQS